LHLLDSAVRWRTFIHRANSVPTRLDQISGRVHFVASLHKRRERHEFAHTRGGAMASAHGCASLVCVQIYNIPAQTCKTGCQFLISFLDHCLTSVTAGKPSS